MTAAWKSRVTLDTGRRFPETYELGRRPSGVSGRRLRATILFTRIGKAGRAARNQWLLRIRDAQHGVRLVRKVGALDRALNGARAWSSGLWADQSATGRTWA